MAGFSAEEIERYKRQFVLKELGGAGQQRLKSARVLVVGAGGLGSPLLLYLAGAGIGTIGIFDDDCVSLDNLHRQIAYSTEQVGRSKTESAATAIAALNSNVQVVQYPLRINAGNALDIISQFDIVADGSDNFATRYLVSDACFFAKKTLVFAAVGPLDAYLSTFKPHEVDADGRPFPTYRCLFPEPPPPGTVANCSEVGVLGPVVGVAGTLQAVEIIKEITGIGHSLSGRLLIYDAAQSRFESIKVIWDPANPLNGTSPSITDLSIHTTNAGPACRAAE